MSRASDREESDREETLVSEDELADDADRRDALRLGMRGKPFTLDRGQGEKTYYRVPRAIAEAVLAGRRLIPGDAPKAIGPRGASARQSGAFAGWSTELRGDTRYRIPVLRLDTARWTVIDIDTQAAELTAAPGNLAAVVETKRGLQLILQGPPAVNADLPFVQRLQEKADESYRRISEKRGTFNLRATDKARKGEPRELLVVKRGANPAEERDLVNLVNAWRGAGGKARRG